MNKYPETMNLYQNKPTENATEEEQKQNEPIKVEGPIINSSTCIEKEFIGPLTSA